MNEDRVNDVVSDVTTESHAHAPEQPELEQADCERECKCTQREEALEPELALTVRVFVHDKKMIIGVEADYAKKGLEESWNAWRFSSRRHYRSAFVTSAKKSKL